MARAAEVVALRALGLTLAQIARALDGEAQDLSTALAAQETLLNNQILELVCKVNKVRAVRSDLAQGQMPQCAELTRLLDQTQSCVAFELPWPWGGELFELRNIRPLNYIIGSLGSGKTRLACRLAESLSNASYLGLSRLENAGALALTAMDADPALASRVRQALTWLTDEGATQSDALVALLVGLETEGPAVLIIDMVEQDLDQQTQGAVITYLRHRARTGARPLFLLTRSSAILDLAAVGPDESIILCPPNHSPPTRVAPYPGAAGYEAVATCLASPEVRARVAQYPQTA
jgi:hypothetical protein